MNWIFKVIGLLLLFVMPAYGAGIDLKSLGPAATKQGWTAKENKVSILSADQKKKKLGLLGHSKAMPKNKMGGFRTVKAVPASYDWRQSGMVTPVKDQGNCGSCWAFAAIGGLESALAIKGGGVMFDLSEQILVSCDQADQGCNGGYMDSPADFLKNTGTGPETCFPYSASDASCSKACANWQSTAYKLSSWGFVTSVQPDVDSIKAALVSYGPLPTTMMVYSDFMYYSAGVYRYTSGGFEGGHAILIVGYDDATQSFTVKNSWGEDFGEKGYFRIGYSELTSRVLFGEETLWYDVGQIPPPTPPVPPVPPTPPAPGCNTAVGKPGENTIKPWYKIW